MEAQNRVQWVYASRDNEELAARYDRWSSDYDVDLAEEFGWVGPQRAAEVFARFVPKQGRVLDAGAGTGLTGRCLAALGYRDLLGIDLSAGMLEQAGQKGVYRELRRMVLGEPLDLEAGTFAGVISVGVFTLGHAPATALRELVRVTQAGGHVIFTLRPDVYESAGFREEQDRLVADGAWELVEVGEPFQTLPKGEPEVYHRVWVYRIPS